jgi:hypothetical protein
MSNMAVDLHSLPEGWQSVDAVRNNGPDTLALERYKLRELAEGWPMYRYSESATLCLSHSTYLHTKMPAPTSDACEWENLLSIFHPSAYIYTTWTGRTHHLDFIAASKRGMDAGAFIMHRCHGVSTDIRRDATRAVTKMKATITQRFALEGGEADAESDCRFCFFWEKVEGEWKARFVRHWYEKVSEARAFIHPSAPSEKRLLGLTCAE